MNPASSPRALPGVLRFSLLLTSLVLLFGIFITLRALFMPSQYLNAYKAVEKGPAHAADLQKLPERGFNQFLYLVGSISPASGEKLEQLFPLLPFARKFELAPSTFSDATGAVEVLAPSRPESVTSLGGYLYNKPFHMLGWRISSSGFALFLVAQNQEDLLKLTGRYTSDWKKILLLRGLLLLGLVFLLFWFLNMSVLNNVRITLGQVLVVNVIFLMFLYSALLLTAYPLYASSFVVLLVLVLGNLVFVPLTLLFQKSRLAPKGA